MMLVNEDGSLASTPMIDESFGGARFEYTYSLPPTPVTGFPS